MRLFARILLLSLPCVALLAGPPAAQNSPSMTMNGVTFSVSGGQEQMLNPIAGGVEVVLDGRRIQLTGAQVIVDGASYPTSSEARIDIDASAGLLRISADGRLIMEETEIDKLARAAEAGDTLAMNNLAIHLLTGAQTDVDVPRAIALLERAAGLGAAKSMRTLALLYYEGTAVPADLPRARELAQQAADLGDGPGQRLVGIFLSDGLLQDPDPAAAAQWFALAAAQGDAAAQNRLGEAYRDGLGVDADLTRAATLFRQATTAKHQAGTCNYAQALWDGAPAHGPGSGLSDRPATGAAGRAGLPVPAGQGHF
ncbi:tetratricopeptide repeat protein [Sulfitobacter porphyrae]|uniref:Tetratricopeptide repeat protein n=1 Tax=Sulfitobacter porphyrae TaxID=1246864 RepID=A0ABW2B459_9RHOB